MNYAFPDPVPPPSSLSGSTLETAAVLSWEPQRLTYTKPLLTNDDIALLARPNLRHKFIVYGVEAYSKEDILDAAIAACPSEVLLPMLYILENPHKATFIVRCSIMAIKKLVSQGLRLSMPNGATLGVDIVLGYLDVSELDADGRMRMDKVHPHAEVNEALKKRYNRRKKILDLSDFKNDESLRHVYCPLSSPRIFHIVIRCCHPQTVASTREPKLSVRNLILRNNDLTGLTALDFNYHLTSIDLRNNKIDNISHLNYFKDYKITELWLDGNPLCSLYETRNDYVTAVQSVFPHIQKLDGVFIDVQTKFIPPIRANYLGDCTRVNVVKQFIQHYFTYYDQNDRNVMNGLYDHGALFSITLGPIINSTYLQMTKAFANNRNLLKFVDYAKCREFLLRGPENIIAALRRQPATYHDYKKFNVDIIHSNDESVTIAVQGTFRYKEYPQAPLSFNRTFVIVELEDNEYCIANDQYHIQSESLNPNASPDEERVETVVPKIEPTCFSRTEKLQLLRFLGERTTMNEVYCRHYLENANWNIRVALSAFMKSYTVNDIPPEAFQEHAYS